jgi:cation diffusion facilitator family transporter
MNDGDTGKERTPEQVLWLGLWANSALAGLKLVVGWFTGSRALMADGWHSLSDILTNGGVWLAHRWAKAPPDEDHHYGHGNAEALAGVIVGLILLGGGVGVAWSGLTSSARLHEGASVWAALGMAGVSIAANLGLALVTLRTGRRTGSHGILALGRDNASDALAGVLVILGILGSRIGLGWAEPVVALLIGGLIVVMGFRSIREGIAVLMDRVDDPGLRRRLREVAAGVAEVEEVQDIRLHPLGAEIRADMQISVDGDLTVSRGHEIAHCVECAVTKAHPRVREVHVHVNPGRSPSSGEPT